MRKVRLVANTLFCFVLGLCSAQLTTSNLPIVVINTNGQTIPDEPKIVASMGIIDNSSGMNAVSDPFNHYDGNIGIELRGNSTQGFDKKTYSVELRTASDQDTSVNLFGMGSEEDWILHAMVIDKSQLRIPMSFYLSQQMGQYAPKWRYVELMINGDYRGSYILCEKIKRDNDRVDIAKLDNDDLAGDSLTGGYILRIDWLDDMFGFASNFDAQAGYPMFYQWYYPKATNIQPAQAAYIESWMDQFEEAVFDANYTNAQGVRYSDYINVNSFVDFIIINELSKNADGYKLSSYLYKDREDKGGKLTAGPIWDFDQTYGVSTVCSCDDPTGWTYLQNQPGCEDLESMPMWWQAMMNDPLFLARLKCRWNDFRTTILHDDSLDSWIDDHVNLISDARQRNFTRWPNDIGNQIWFEPSPIPQSYTAEISALKTWLQARTSWLDANMPGNCANDVLSVQDAYAPGEIRVFPNPTSGELFISADSFKGLNVIRVSDMAGRTVLAFPIRREGIVQLDVSSLKNGVYLINLEGSAPSQVHRFVKQ